MSSFERRILLAALGASVLGASGCLKPMLAKDTAASTLRGQVAFDDVSDRFGYYLSESLEARLGQTRDAAYQLRIARSISETGVAIARDNTATRITLLLNATWQLVRLRDGAAVLSDTVTMQSGYNATTSLFAGRQTRLDIERRLARSLGERIARSIQARAGEITA